MVIAQNLPLPPVDYMPVNLEQEIVMVADKYNSKSIPPKFLTAEAYTRKAARFGESNKREWLRLLERYGVSTSNCSPSSITCASLSSEPTYLAYEWRISVSAGCYLAYEWRVSQED